MKLGAHVVVAATARTYAPLMALFAFALLCTQPAGAGVGFAAGLGFALLLMLHALTFGAAAARRAFPSVLARLAVGLGVCGVCAGVGLPRFAYAPQLVEGALFLATTGALALVVQVVFGRVPTLRDAG